MATWGVKVSDELKDKLSDAMKTSGLDGEGFAEQLYTLFVAEALKNERPQFSQELQELQALTQRVYSIYLNNAERTENLLNAKQESFESLMREKDEELRELKSKLNGREAEYDSLVTAYNNLSEDKNKADNSIRNLEDSLKTKQELIDEYKSKNDTLSGIINEYKEFKEQAGTLKDSLARAEQKHSELNLTVKEYESVKKRLIEDIAKLEETHEKSLLDISERYNSNLEDLKIRQKEQMEKLLRDFEEEKQRIADKAEFEKDKAALALNRTHQEEMDKLNNKYHDRINTLQEQINTLMLSVSAKRNIKTEGDEKKEA